MMVRECLHFMFEDHSEAVDWFTEEAGSSTQKAIINGLNDRDRETVRDQVNDEHLEGFLGMREEIRQAQMQDDLPRQTIIDQMTDEGFDMMTAGPLYDSVRGNILTLDLSYIRSNTTPEETGVLIEEAVYLFNGTPRQDPTFSRDDDLMNRALRVLTAAYIPRLANQYQPFQGIEESLRDAGQFEDQRVGEFIEPLKSNKVDLLQMYNFNRVENISDTASTLESKLETIESQLEHISHQLSDRENRYDREM